MLAALAKCSDAFARVKTFRSRVTGHFGTVLVDYRAPDVFHLSGIQSSTVLVGERAYDSRSAGWVGVDPREAIFLRDLVLTPRIMVKWARLTVPVFVREFASAVGPVRIFRYVSYDNSTELYTTIWIAKADNLPRYASFDTFDTHTTVEYSAFNQRLDFSTPAVR